MADADTNGDETRTSSIEDAKASLEVSLEDDNPAEPPIPNEDSNIGEDANEELKDDKKDEITSNHPSNGAEEENPSSNELKVETETNEIPTTIVFSSVKAWSETLQSPKIPAFSPSLNPNRPGSLHGLGKAAVADA